MTSTAPVEPAADDPSSVPGPLSGPHPVDTPAVRRHALSIGVSWFAPSPEHGLDDEGPDPLTFAPDRVAALTGALEQEPYCYRCTRLTGPDTAPAETLPPGVSRAGSPAPDGHASDSGPAEAHPGWQPSAARLGVAVRQALTTAGPEDVCVVHVLSHGVVRPTGLYTLGADSVHTEWTSVRNWLSAVEDFPGRPLVLFLLDLCHSGAAARFDHQLSGLTDGHHRAWVIAASGPSELAVEGRFTRAVADVLNAVAERRIQYDHSRRHLGFHWFVDRVRDRLRELVEERGGMAHRVTADVLDTVAPDLPFFPNPCFTPGPADVAQAPPEPGPASDVRCDDVADPDHFLRHARGGAGFAARPGTAGEQDDGLFTGRHAELLRLAEWLEAGPTAARLQVVTGSPGSGKSALLGVVLRAVHPGVGSTTGSIPEMAALSRTAIAPPLAVHARQRTLAEIVDSLTRQAGAHAGGWADRADGPEGDPRRLMDVLSRSSGSPPVLVVDALDEARDAAALVHDLLIPLTTLTRPDGRPLCRLLLAARDEEPCSDLIATARADGSLIDLDRTSRQTLATDLARYVTKLLDRETGAAGAAANHDRAGTGAPIEATHTGHGQESADPLNGTAGGEEGGAQEHDAVTDERRDFERGMAAFAEATADALTDPERATTTGPYLMAALYASYASQEDVRHRLGDPVSAAELGAEVPRDLPALLDLGFAHGHAHRLLRPVLTALAFAQGDGMPVSLVAAVARAFVTHEDGAAGEGRTAAEGAPVADSAGSPPPVTPPGTVDASEVARLLSDLRAFLRTVADRTGTVLYRLLHQSVADELRGLTVETAAGKEERPDAEDRRVAGAVYDALIDSLSGPVPGGPPRWAGLDGYLRRHLAQHAFDAGRFDELCAEPQFLVHADPDWLDPELGRTTSEAARGASAVYRTSAHVHRRTSDEQRRHILAVDAVRHQAHTLADRLAAPGPGCGEAMPWRPQWATGSRISAAHAFTLHLPEDRTTALTGALVDVPIVVTGGRSGRLRVWDANNGRLLHTADPGLGEIRALACTRIDDAPVVVVAGSDGSLTVRSLPTLAPVAAPGLRGRGEGGVRAVTAVDLANRSMALTADSSGRLVLWDLTGDLPREELRTGLGRTTALVCVPGDDAPSVVVADEEGTVRICSLLGDSREDGAFYHPGRVNALAYAVVDGTRYVVTGGEDGAVRAWDFAGRVLRTESAPRHDGPVYALACLEDEDGDSRVLSAGSDGTIRLWEPRDGSEHSRFVGHMGAVTALAHPPSLPPVVVSAGMDAALRVWHVPTGRQRVAPAVGHTSWVNALARAVVGGREMLISAGADGLLHRWDLDSGTPYENPPPLARPPAAGVTPPEGTGPLLGAARAEEDRPVRVHALAVTLHEGRPLVVSAGPDGLLRCWDAERGTPYGDSFTPATAPVHAVSATALAGRPLVVAGGADGRLHCWDVATGRRRGLPLAGHTGGVNALTCMELDTGPTVLSCGDDGTLRLWDLTTGLPVCPPVDAHSGWATALAGLSIDGRPLAVTGGQDGRVRLWDLSRPEPGSGLGRVRPYGEPLSVSGGVNAVACTVVGGAPLVAASDDWGVRLWDFASGVRRTDIGVPGTVPSLLLHGDRLALGCEWEVIVLRRSG
ncbi:NACHT and WD repeat domain-containing protein [Streptomyces bobili]|uniref:NACHT and WD repeat domain-containing protein n=1 Tax=Streptomyces bobili TaxID=67280 RepID=UPI0022587F83|nr:NACHT and WD repeat domain-containing protein [Streptomyces bobili]MCX5521371.1 NACHT and WD repeat domain-containing protein [Streptomyces bobili]